MGRRITVEVCVDSLDSVASALPYLRPGDRFEVCANLIEGGGLTPSVGLVKNIKRMVESRGIGIVAESRGIGIMVMVRPRSGSFVYTPLERQVMKADIESLGEAGADGFVFGCLTPNGDVDLEAMIALVGAVGGKPVTFHRAFDVANDWRKALVDISTIPSITRILTSGQAPTAIRGASLLRSLFSASTPYPHLSILIGSGISSAALAQLRPLLPGFPEFHLSSSAAVPYDSPGSAVARGVEMGFGAAEWKLDTTKLAAISKLLDEWEKA